LQIPISVGLLLNTKPAHGKPHADSFLFIVDYFEDLKEQNVLLCRVIDETL
jgi:hypothetical protein